MEKQLFHGHILTSKIGVSGSTTYRFFTLGPKEPWVMPRNPTLKTIREAKWKAHGLYHINMVKTTKKILTPYNIQLTFQRPFCCYLVIEQHFSDWVGSEFFDADTGAKADSDSLTLAAMQLWALKRNNFIKENKALYNRLTKGEPNEKAVPVLDPVISHDVIAVAEWVCA